MSEYITVCQPLIISILYLSISASAAARRELAGARTNEHETLRRPRLRLRDSVAYRACERELPVEQSQYSEIQRRIRHVAKCLYMRARALIIIAIYNASVSAGAVKWQDKDRFDSCCTRNQQRHSIIVFIASQIPYNEIHFLTTSICTVIAA